MQRWIKNHPGNAIEELTSEFRALLKDQKNGSHKWHLKKTWDNQLCDILDNKDDLDEDNLVNWENIINSDRSLSSHPFVRLINVTEERGPGFDIIDPFGPLKNTHETLYKNLNFLPVEVKAVGGNNPPFSFRLTTNEYNRLKAFLNSGHNYSIRLVYVPEPGKTNWISQCSFVAERLYDKKEIPELVPQDKNFEAFVKGGYMNVKVD